MANCSQLGMHIQMCVGMGTALKTKRTENIHNRMQILKNIEMFTGIADAVPNTARISLTETFSVHGPCWLGQQTWVWQPRKEGIF